MGSRDSSSTHARGRADAVRQSVQTREARIQQLRGRYCKHGERIVTAVVQAFKQEGDLRRLVHRVTGRVVTAESKQHQVLAEFIKRHGGEVFLRQAKMHAADEKSPFAQCPGIQSAPPAPAPAAPNPAGRQRIRLPSGEVIADRRLRRERRTGVDRRVGVDLIYKNRRFGVDRRGGRERRVTLPVVVSPR